jgi:cyclophilin family peptidyl-prolyl cis-trans isomerase
MKRVLIAFFMTLFLAAALFPQARKPAPIRPASPASPPEPAFSVAELKKLQAVLETSQGEIVIEFYPDKAPNHVNYFASLVKSGSYNGTTFHRMLLGGFIQGGDPYTKDPAKKAQYGTGGLNKLKAEFNDTKLLRGTVAAVLQPPNPDSAGAQFFICVSAQPQLDGQLTAWGHVVEGIEVVDRISATPADSHMMATDRVEIFKAYLRPIPPPQPVPFAEATPDEMKKCHVLLETSMGGIEIELLPDAAPEHVRNFLRLAQTHLYDNSMASSR